MKLKKYTVEVVEERDGYIEVKARNEKEAKEKAEKLFSEDKNVVWGDGSGEIVQVTEDR